jgi:hypothetical protein
VHSTASLAVEWLICYKNFISTKNILLLHMSCHAEQDFELVEADLEKQPAGLKVWKPQECEGLDDGFQPMELGQSD